MNSETTYKSNQVLIDEQAIQDEHYANQQMKKAHDTMRQGICLKIDVLSKNIMNLFHDENIWKVADPVLIHLVFNQMDYGIHHVDFLNNQGQLISNSSRKINDLSQETEYNNKYIYNFLAEISSNMEELYETIQNFIHEPDEYIMACQGNQGLDEEEYEEKIPFLRVHKTTIHQDIQQVMNQFIQTIDPNYLRAKENYSLKYHADVDPGQSSQNKKPKLTL